MPPPLPPADDDRVVNGDKSDVAITGIGLACGLGLDVETVWRRVRRGSTCFGPMPAMEQPLPAGATGGQAPELPAHYEPSLPREARYLRWVIEAALRDAALLGERPYADDRCVLMLGTTLHGMRAGGEFLRSGDTTRLASFLAGDTARLAAAGLRLNGGAMTTCSACSSSLGAVALGVTLLESGEADLVVAGGYDAISEYAWAGFNALRVVADGPLRPFARGRAGMKIAEGYGIVILERTEVAERRRAMPRAIVAGWGESADAHHLTRPHPEGDGALAAMRQALRSAAISPDGLDLIAAHATGTPDNDSSEASAIGRLLGGARVPVVGFKSHLGHTLGAAGAVELILSTLAIRDQVIPPTASVEAGDVEYAAVALATGHERAADVRHTLNTSLGFGGANTCVVLRQPAMPLTARSRPRREADQAVITGIGAVLPGTIGNAALVEALRAGRLPTEARTIVDAEVEPCLNARRARRMSAYVKLSLAAVTLACRDAGLADDPTLLADACAMLGTTHGSSGYCYDYYEQVVREGVCAANPMLFAEGVPNAAAAQVSLMLGLRGAGQTMLGTRTAGLDALRLAALRVQSGTVERVIVCAAEEAHSTIDAAYSACNAAQRPSRSAAVAFIVESRRAAEARGALPLARIAGGRSSSSPASAVAADRDARAADHAMPPLATSVFSNTGDDFSVHALLQIAGELLDPTPTGALAFSVQATDRTGVTTMLELRHMSSRPRHGAAIDAKAFAST